MSDSVQTISDDIKEAMKAKNTLALNALRALKSALTNASIEKGGLGTVLENSEVLAVIRKQMKQRQDSIEQFEKAGRSELVATEKAEIEVLSKYLPTALTEEEISQIVQQAISETGAASKANMGKVMKRAQELSDGRADGKLLSSLVMKSLS